MCWTYNIIIQCSTALKSVFTGTVEPKTANVTEEELNKVEGNLTFSESNAFNSTNKARNVTISLNKDEKSQIEDELQSNKTSTNITEDNEKFQEQEIEFPARHCMHYELVKYSHSYCGDIFHKEMQSIGTENWCNLEKIIRPYNSLTVCLENLSHLVDCYYPNTDIQDFFLYTHSYYFHNCSAEEMMFPDAPYGLVIVLTLIPVSLIPVLVYLVVWKSEIQK